MGILLLRVGSLTARHPAQAFCLLSHPHLTSDPWCVYECFFWKQLLHKLFDRILASSILCTIIFQRKLALSSFNNCFICWLLWHNWKHGWYWFKNPNCLVVKWIKITVLNFKWILEVLDDFCLCCGACWYFGSLFQSPDYCVCCEGLEGWSVVAVGTLQNHNPANPDLEEAPLGIEMPKWWAFMSSRSQAGFRMQEETGISFPVPADWVFLPLFAMPFHVSVKIKV